MVLYAYMCCVCIFSLHRESPDMILGDKPLFLRCFFHNYHIPFHFETEIYIYFWTLSIQESSTLPYTHVDYGSLNALGGKSLISRSTNSCLLKTYDLILHIVLSQHKCNLNHDVFGMNTWLVVIGVKYYQLISAAWLMWIFQALFHS
jgi:hypothetical protein